MPILLYTKHSERYQNYKLPVDNDNKIEAYTLTEEPQYKYITLTEQTKSVTDNRRRDSTKRHDFSTDYSDNCLLESGREK